MLYEGITEFGTQQHAVIDRPDDAGDQGQQEDRVDQDSRPHHPRLCAAEVVFGRVLDQTPLVIHVITSYSIHYTKLYDVRHAATPPIPATGGPARDRFPGCGARNNFV